MVKPPPGAWLVQAESRYQVTVPVESELAVKGTPPGPALTALPKLSWSCTVITPDSPAQAPAVKVREGVMNTSQIAKAVGLDRMAVARIKQNPANAKRQLTTWGL